MGGIFDGLGGFFSSAASGLGDALGFGTDTGGKGNGVFGSDVVGALVKGGLGLAGTYMTQADQRKAAEQYSAMATDQFNQDQALKKEALANQLALGYAQVGAQKKATLANLYSSYGQATERAGADQLQGTNQVAQNVANPIEQRAKKSGQFA